MESGQTQIEIIIGPFLADRTNGRTYATVLRLSVVCRLSVCRRLWRYVLWLNGAS